MELKDLNKLKETWLSGFPDSTHPLDAKRFIRYAIALAREHGTLDHEEMAARGISQQHIDAYELKYEFLRDVLEVLGES